MNFSARGKTTGIMEVTNAENDAISRERNRWTDMAGQGGEKSHQEALKPFSWPSTSS